MMFFPRRIPSWTWFFAVLTLLGLAAIAVPLWFNLSQQLRPEELARARELWERNQPADYDIEYSQTGLTPEKFTVRVRGHQVRSVTSDDRPLPPGSYPYDDMGALFRFIETHLANDNQPGSPRTFTVAGFAREDGHVLHYIRSVWSTHERIEIDVRLHPVASGGP
jgi:hypothetical protein